MKSTENQRQYPRRTSFIIAEYTVAEGTFRDIIRNIGAGGLFIDTNRDLAVGQDISITFPLFNFDNLIQTHGKVVRKDPDGLAVSFSTPIEGLICKEGYFPEIVNEIDR